MFSTPTSPYTVAGSLAPSILSRSFPKIKREIGAFFLQAVFNHYYFVLLLFLCLNYCLGLFHNYVWLSLLLFLFYYFLIEFIYYLRQLKNPKCQKLLCLCFIYCFGLFLLMFLLGNPYYFFLFYSFFLEQ